VGKKSILDTLRVKYPGKDVQEAISLMSLGVNLEMGDISQGQCDSSKKKRAEAGISIFKGKVDNRSRARGLRSSSHGWFLLLCKEILMSLSNKNHCIKLLFLMISMV
jgi:hypothetical protein